MRAQILTGEMAPTFAPATVVSLRGPKRGGKTRLGPSLCESPASRLDTAGAALIFAAMPVVRELRRRSQDDRSLRSFEPCLPRPPKQPPSGPGWIHEIKHDGFRILARRDAKGVRLFTRIGYNFANENSWGLETQ